MEDMILGLFLFILFQGFLGWLFSESTQRQSSSVDNDDAWEMNQEGEIVVVDEAGEASTIKPIEQQFKDILWDIDGETGTVTKVHKPTVEELLDGVEVEKITLRKARKIASALGIRQKVNSKDLFFTT